MNFPDTVGLVTNTKFHRRGNRAARAFGERCSEYATGPIQLQRFDYLFRSIVVRDADRRAMIVETVRDVITEPPVGNGVDLKIGKAIHQTFRRLRRVEWRATGNRTNTINVMLRHLFRGGTYQWNTIAKNFFYSLNHTLGDRKAHGVFTSVQHFIFSK